MTRDLPRRWATGSRQRTVGETPLPLRSSWATAFPFRRRTLRSPGVEPPLARRCGGGDFPAGQSHPATASSSRLRLGIERGGECLGAKGRFRRRHASYVASGLSRPERRFSGWHRNCHGLGPIRGMTRVTYRERFLPIRKRRKRPRRPAPWREMVRSRASERASGAPPLADLEPSEECTQCGARLLRVPRRFFERLILIRAVYYCRRCDRRFLRVLGVRTLL